MELFNRQTLNQRVPVLRSGGTRAQGDTQPVSFPPPMTDGLPVPGNGPGNEMPVSVQRQNPPVLSERVVSTTVAPPVLASLADFFTALGNPAVAQRQGEGRILQARQDLADQRSLADRETQLTLTQQEFQQAAEERAEQRRLQTIRDERADRQLGIQEKRLSQQERIANMRAELDLLKTQAQDERQIRALEAAEKRFTEAQVRQDARQLRGFQMQLQLLKEKQTVGPSQRTALAEMRTLRDVEFANVEKTFAEAKDIIGPAASRLRSLGTSIGRDVDPKFLELRAAVAGLRNKLLKIRSGAAVTDQELRRVATEELPNENDTPQNFQIKLDTALQSLRQTITIFEEVHGIGGDAVQEAPTTQRRRIDLTQP